MRRYLSTLPIAIILIGVLGHGLSEKVHARLLSTGESLWPGYHRLRVDPTPPDCPIITADPAQQTDDLDKLLEDGPSEPASPASELDELLAEGDEAPGLHAEAIAAASRQCEEQRALYQRIVESITPAVRGFRLIETTVALWPRFTTNHLSHFLVLLFLIAAATSTWTGSHIALRPPNGRQEGRVRAAGELLANGLLLKSSIALWQVEAASGVSTAAPELHAFLIAGFAVMAGMSLWRLIQPPADLAPGGSLLRGLLTVPLYASMAQIAGLYFLIAEGHGAGLAIQLGKLTEHALLYMDVGLYVWAGMLLKQTHASDLVLNMSRPWRMSPEPFALAIVALAALPTAYSGASGILVIAAGGLIYPKLREVGSRRELALATTAMAGSTGVVLSPCLLVVIIANLNKEVTTAQLYHSGKWVFALTLVVMGLILWWTRQEPWRIASPRQAVPESLRQGRPLLPYVAIFAGCVLFFRVALDARLDEHSAPVLLPIILLLLLAYDRWAVQGASRRDGETPRPPGLVGAATEATRETVTHIGALLTLMGLSVGLGGVVERGDLMSVMPDQFGSPWGAMAAFVVILVLVGMTMDPYGAVILVSATLPRLAEQSGIDPGHFWMVVLVAFELGYLTPPVALNHLLTRQVVGPEEVAADAEVSGNFWARHERLLLPVTVIGVVLLLVAFVPLMVRTTSAAGTG